MRLRARNASAARVERSAQCRSSISSSTGRSAPSASSSDSRPSNSRACVPSSPFSAAGAEPGQQRRDRRAHLVGQRRVAGAGERAQRGHQRHVRELALAEVDAVAREHERPVPGGAALELRQQPRLATPDSPATNISVGSPSAAAASAASSSSSSAVRPIRRELVTRVAIF